MAGRVKARNVPSTVGNFISKLRLYPFLMAFKPETIKAGKKRITSRSNKGARPLCYSKE
jgi:hypothetical protein